MEIMRRRLSPRYEVGSRFGHLGWELQADLLNISLGGIAVQLRSYLELGTTVQMEFPRDHALLGLDGTTRWCHPVDGERSGTAGSELRCEVGVQFSGGLADRSQELLDFISNTPIISVQRGTFGRFVLDYGQPIRLTSTCPFRLKVLSYSGMLVETPVALARESRINLSLPLGNGNEDFKACGRVANVTPGDEEDLPFKMGIGFDELTEAQQPVLRAFVENALGQRS